MIISYKHNHSKQQIPKSFIAKYFFSFPSKKFVKLKQINFSNNNIIGIMLIVKSHIFSKYPEIIFGFSTKVGAGRKAPYFFNVSQSVGDNKKIVDENRDYYFNSIGLKFENVAFQKQVHGDTITYVTKGGVCGESDAMITDKKNLGLAISTADCAAIFIFDKKNKVIAGVHSGWRGSEKKILLKTLIKLNEMFDSNPDNLLAYVGPSITKMNYEVGKEVAVLFEKKYRIPFDEKYCLDVSQVNQDILLNFGLKKSNIQVSSLCTYEHKNLLHSYRRDGKRAGRALGVIAMKDFH